MTQKAITQSIEQGNFAETITLSIVSAHINNHTMIVKAYNML